MVVYFDNAATTRPFDEVIEGLKDFWPKIMVTHHPCIGLESALKRC